MRITELFMCKYLKEPLIKSFLNALSEGFSSVGNDAFGFNQHFLKNYLLKYLLRRPLKAAPWRASSFAIS